MKILYEVDSQCEVNRNGYIPHGHLMLLIDSTTTTCLMTGENGLGGVRLSGNNFMKFSVCKSVKKFDVTQISIDLAIKNLEPLKVSDHPKIIFENFIEKEGKDVSVLTCKIKSFDEKVTFAIGSHTKFMHPLSRSYFRDIHFE